MAFQALARQNITWLWLSKHEPYRIKDGYGFPSISQTEHNMVMAFQALARQNITWLWLSKD